MNNQITTDKQIAFVEILEILKHMNKDYSEKIPKKLISFFESNKSNDYNFEYNNNKSFSEQNLNYNTKVLLAILHLNYWCKSEEHKKELISTYMKNDETHQKELMEKYNPDNIFKNKIIQKQENKKEKNEEKALVEYKENKFIKFIKKLIKKLF